LFFTDSCEIKTTKIWIEKQVARIFAVRKKNLEKQVLYYIVSTPNFFFWLDVKKLKIRKINLAEIKRLVHLHSQLKRVAITKPKVL